MEMRQTSIAVPYVVVLEREREREREREMVLEGCGNEGREEFICNPMLWSASWS